jgi:hypothetical protein
MDRPFLACAGPWAYFCFFNLQVLPGPTTGPQPVIFDPVLNITFPFNLTGPEHVPKHNLNDHPTASRNFSAAEANQVISHALAEVKKVIFESDVTDNCTKCVAILEVGQRVARTTPSLLPETLLRFCKLFKILLATLLGAKHVILTSPQTRALPGVCVFSHLILCHSGT